MTVYPLTEMVQSREGYIETTDATIWHKVFYTRSSQQKTPLICIHGGPGCTHEYMLSLQKLAGINPVVFYDQSGSNRSSFKNASFQNLTLDHYVQELEDIIKELGFSEVYLLGSSWGGSIATVYADKHPKKVKGLILASPLIATRSWVESCVALTNLLPQEVAQTIIQAERDQKTDTPAYELAMSCFYKNYFCRLDPWPVDLNNSMRSLNHSIYQTMWGPYESVAKGTLKDLDLLPELKRLKMPTLVTCGRYDMASPEMMQEYVMLIPQADLLIFEHSSHVAFLEEPDLFLTALKDFMQRT